MVIEGIPIERFKTCIRLAIIITTLLTKIDQIYINHFTLSTVAIVPFVTLSMDKLSDFMFVCRAQWNTPFT